MADKKDMVQEKLAKIQQEAEEREAQRKASELKIDYLSPTKIPIQVTALELISEEKARLIKVAPFQFRKPDVALAVYNPESEETKQFIQSLKSQNLRVKVFVVSKTALEHIWSFYQYVIKAAPTVTGKFSIEKEKFEKLTKELVSLEKVKDAMSSFNFQTRPTAELLEVMLAGSVATRASDVHLEPEEKQVGLRYRIDGVLHAVAENINHQVYPFLISRLKLISNLKINVTDEPQEGRFTLNVENKEIEIRVSIIPSEFGETVVMRILNPDVIQLSLEELGLRKDDYQILKEQIIQPNGMLLNTGPTGSGKTTTLYASLNYLKSEEIKIITIEDPIEYHLEGIEQTQVNPESKYDFANGLQSLMRQDPDVILVGEIRDQKTAEIAMQAALTGHLVFSTVHANSAAGAVPRLLDLGVRSSSIGPALNLVIAQRLVRRLCEKCKVPEKVSEEIKIKIEKFLSKLPARVDKSLYKKIQLYKPQGCPDCHGIGYRGRVAVFEMLEAGSEIEKLISQNTSEGEIYKFALEKQDMVTMQQDGILKVILGVTTFEEVEGVTGAIKWQ